MKELKKFIKSNLNVFSNLGNNEVIEYNVNEFDDKIIGYLFKHGRFDYKDVCVYLVKGEQEGYVIIENMIS